MWDTAITISRNGTTLTGSDGRAAVHIGPVMVVQASDKEVIDLKMIYTFQGNLVYKLNVPWYPNSLIQQQDILIDEQVIDPDRGAPFRYRVIGRPKNFYPSDHQEVYCIVEVGT